MKKLLSIGLAMLASSTCFAQGSGGVGNGGDAYVGPEFYTMAGRLAKEPALVKYQLEAVLASPLHILPADEALIYEAGGVKTQVDALSYHREGKAFTRVDRAAWGLNSCKKKYRLTLHELFVLKDLEDSVSYTASGPIMDQIEENLDCRGTGEELARTIFTVVKRAISDRFKTDKDFVSAVFDAQVIDILLVRFNHSMEEVLNSTPFAVELKACRLGAGKFFLQTALDHSTTTIDKYAQAIYNVCYRDGGITPSKITFIQTYSAIYADLRKHAQFGKADDVGMPVLFFSGKPRKLGHYYSTFAEPLLQDLSSDLLKETHGLCDLKPAKLEALSVSQNWLNLHPYELVSALSHACEQ